MPIELISNIAQKNRAANVSNTAFFYLMDTSNIDYRIAGIQNDSSFTPTLTDNFKYIIRNPNSLNASFGSISGVSFNDIVICQSGLFYVYVDVSNSKTNQGGLVYNDADDKLYYYNGVDWKSLGLGSLVGTPDQIQITGSTGDVQVGLTPIVIVQNIIQTPILRFANGITMGSVGDIIQLTGNLNIKGSLLVDGEVVTKTTFSGYTLDSELETVVSVAVDAGDY
jgi:hypothetical protein